MRPWIAGQNRFSFRALQIAQVTVSPEAFDYFMTHWPPAEKPSCPPGQQNRRAAKGRTDSECTTPEAKRQNE
jgi:hypothetical protein